METIGQRIKASRSRSVMTQADVANAAGVALITINRLENDAVENPRPHTVRKIAAVLAVDPSWLLFGEEESKMAA